MIATVPTPTAASVPGSPTVELLGVVRRRRSTAERLDALTRLESERSRLVRQNDWWTGRASPSDSVLRGTPVTPS